VAELLRQGRREADLFRRELSRCIKAVHVYADGLVRVTASLTGALDYPPVSLRKCGSGGRLCSLQKTGQECWRDRVQLLHRGQETGRIAG